MLIIPDSWNVHQFATAGDFNSFLEMYASIVEAQRTRQRTEVALSIDEVWERFQGQHGLHHIEALCSNLLKEGCPEEDVENFKDCYLADLVRAASPSGTVAQLQPFLTQAIRGFCAQSRAAAASPTAQPPGGGMADDGETDSC